MSATLQCLLFENDRTNWVEEHRRWIGEKQHFFSMWIYANVRANEDRNVQRSLGSANWFCLNTKQNPDTKLTMSSRLNLPILWLGFENEFKCLLVFFHSLRFLSISFLFYSKILIRSLLLRFFFFRFCSIEENLHWNRQQQKNWSQTTKKKILPIKTHKST